MTIAIRDIAASAMPAVEHQLYGIEVELENFRHPPNLAANAWTWTDDGSLRNNGVEFLTPGAWTLPQCVEAIRALWRDIEEFGYTASVRTGIHVHVNCLDYNSEQVGGILATYCLLEPVLFRMCGPEREECIYCVPWYRADQEVEHAAALVLHDDPNRVSRACKYSALYLGPLRRFGTIEFRHAPTFEREEDMITWLSIIDRLVEYGKQRTATEVYNSYVEMGADAWAASVFGPFTSVIQDKCETTFEAIMDEVDSPSVAEALLPLPEGVGTTWSLPTLYVQGDGTTGYHARANQRGRLYIVEEWDEPEEYIEEDF